MKRAILLTGLVVGYVLGARAGRGRYDLIAASVRRLAERPEVQAAAGTIAGQAQAARSRLR
jgi:hypothetical protein